MKKPLLKNFYWIPRIICMLAILFISMFAFDVFSSDDTLWRQMGRFLVHLTPSFILLAFLIIAWRRELLGGIIFSIVGIGLTPLIYQHNYAINHSVGTSIGVVMMVTFPLIVTGVLFIISSRRKKKQCSKKYEY